MHPSRRVRESPLSGKLWRRTALGLAAFVATGSAFAAGTQSWAAPVTGNIVGKAKGSLADSYVVVLKDNGFSKQSRDQRKAAVSASAKTLSGRYGGTVKAEYSTALHGFSVRGLSEAQAKKLAGDSAVGSVVRNEKLSKSVAEPTQYWNLDRIDDHARMNNGVYTYPSTAANVRAYVLDSGVNKDHAEFAGRASYGRNFVDRTGDPDPANAPNNNDPAIADDCDGHGTHVSGIIGGTHTGVAKAIQLVAVKVLDCTGGGYLEEVLGGIDWVTANAVKPAVVNMSLGALDVIPALDDAINQSIRSGLAYSVAAGNALPNSAPTNACNSSPGSARDALVVGASNYADQAAFYSNYGPCLDIWAPGDSVTSAWIGGTNTYNTIGGTSMAAPHVAGAAALILASHPDYVPDQLRQALLQSSTVNVLSLAANGSPNRLLFVRQVDPPRLTSKVVGMYNQRFGTSEAYARAENNHIVYSYWTDEWSDWFDLGGDVAGNPVMLYNARFGTTEVYARLTNNHIAYRVYNNGWSAWTDLGGDAAGDPGVLFNPRFGTTEVYIHTNDNKLQYRYFSNGWSVWNNLDGNVASDPALLYNPKYGTTEVYVRTTDNKLQYRYFSNAWSGWLDLAGTIAGNPQVIINPKYGTTEVYTRTATNTLAYRYFLGSWSGWIDLAGTLDSDPALLYNPTYGTTEAYARTPSNEVQYVYYLGGWSNWVNLNGNTATAPTCIFSPKYKTTEVYTRTAANHGNVIYYANGWQPWSDISA